MKQDNVRSLEDRQTADASECERLSARVYALMDEWESLRKRQRELERQFVENDLVARSGPRKGQPLTPRGRSARLAELLELHLQADQLQRTLAWTERRRVRLLKEQVEPKLGRADA